MKLHSRLLSSFVTLSSFASPCLSLADSSVISANIQIDSSALAPSVENSNISIVPPYSSGAWPSYNTGYYPGYGYNPGGYSANYHPGYYPQYGWYSGPGYYGWPNSGHYGTPYNRWYPTRTVISFPQFLGPNYSYGQPVSCIGIYGRVNPNVQPLDGYGYGYASIYLGGSPFGAPISFYPNQNFYQFCLNGQQNSYGNGVVYPGSNSVTPVYGFNFTELENAQIQFNGDLYIDSVVYY